MKDINMDSSKHKKKSTKCTTETPTTPNNNYITDTQQTPVQVKPTLKELLKRLKASRRAIVQRVFYLSLLKYLGSFLGNKEPCL